MTRELVYGRRPVREALRGPREVLEVWATERAVAAEPWLQDGPRMHVKPDREIGEAAETRDHQGVIAWCEPYRYADAHELAAAERPLLACLDQVTDPRNLGAVIRSAEGAGATGVVVPAHGSARVTAVVCRTSAGAVEHLPVAVVTTYNYVNPVVAMFLGWFFYREPFGWRETLAKWKVSYLLMDPGSAIVSELVRDGNWRVRTCDVTAALLERDSTSAGPDAMARLERCTADTSSAEQAGSS